MPLLMLLAVLFLLVHFPSSLGGSSGEVDSAPLAPKCSVDLHKAIGNKPLGLVVGRGHETLGRPHTSLFFLDDTIVATFVVREREPVLSRRGNLDQSLPLRLRAIFLDVNTGKIMSTQTWPTESRVSDIVSGNDATFVTRRGDLLTQYTLDAREVRALRLPPSEGEQYGWSWFAQASPTGRNILFSVPPEPNTTGATQWVWVSTDDLRVLRSGKEIWSGSTGISDTTIAMIACGFWQFHCEPKVEVRNLATQWKDILPIEKRYDPRPKFLNQNTLFVSGHPWQLLQTEGKIILTEGTPFEGRMAISSSDGKRFVVPFFQSKGGVAALDIGAHGELKAISIYDAPFKERSYRLELKGLKVRDTAQMVLSEDGSKLAILYEESIHIFELPPARRERRPSKSGSASP